ncbi:MAG: hypothetical protein LBB45_01795 [Methanobrevibacter sp.]|nr:hypothetical protein [Candidatus Methanovirga basalitermitum]
MDVIKSNNCTVYVHGVNDLNDVVIDAGGLSNIFTVNSSSALRLENIICKGGSSENGGAIESRGSLILDNCSLENNNARSGGALFALLSSLNKCEIVNTEFTDNTAIIGGSAYIFGQSNDFKMTNSTFKNSEASNGGGFYFLGDNLNIILSDIDFYNNKALVNNLLSDGLGGGLGLFGIFNCSLTKANIHDNEATFGVGVCAMGTLSVDSNMSIADCNISNNEALNYGEGVLVHSVYDGGICSNSGTQDVDDQTKTKFSGNKLNVPLLVLTLAKFDFQKYFFFYLFLIIYDCLVLKLLWFGLCCVNLEFHVIKIKHNCLSFVF